MWFVKPDVKHFFLVSELDFVHSWVNDFDFEGQIHIAIGNGMLNFSNFKISKNELGI